MQPSFRVEKRILLSVPHMGGDEMHFVRDAFASNWLSTTGPSLTALEAEFSSLVGRPCVALITGTSAIHLGLKLLGIGPGDEVATPTLTFAASCNPLLYEKARPVFIDSERETWNLDPNLLEDYLKDRARLNRLPKAVTVVHLFGQSARLQEVLDVCQRYEIPVLEDAAESLGARYHGKHPGTLGEVGAFSFNSNKIITGTSGGMLVAADEDWIQKVRYWSTQARDPDPLGVNNYCHSECGYNYRMSNVIAGIVRGQLHVLDERVRQRRAVFDHYQGELEKVPGITPQPESQARLDSPSAETSRHTRWLSCFLVDEKEFGMTASDLIRFLDAANIEARPVWKPMHTQTLYQRLGSEVWGGAVAQDLHACGICLPSSSSLSRTDQDRVIAAIREASSLR